MTPEELRTAQELFRAAMDAPPRTDRVAIIAGAIRAQRAAAASEALERAAYIAESYGCDYAGREIRALKPDPAVAPAAETGAEVCRAEAASRMPDYSHYECALPKGHGGPHREGSIEWTDKDTVYP